jgi:hypothetical protein
MTLLKKLTWHLEDITSGTNFRNFLVEKLDRWQCTCGRPMTCTMFCLVSIDDM